ncbi:MAG: sugar phosphate isomerase/epimerase [Deltaproteobacteria bacterium]|uniref:sugar phosphate isomerase/epimerase family protein n=1 Tax=Desulfosarcina sp. BuS5 TaxID=933262 RepID=UPI000484D4E5|nr:sugar phosphate isomerase/epimerase [Desulfosarcina sp. BuS5]MCD6272073.1 sugar phosphate isomerase/epimerase [Deltaproteobacteria bacterium]WDN89848.1 hypothetical protein BuS5_02816 [Desulfosarcina sp. BuS5]
MLNIGSKIDDVRVDGNLNKFKNDLEHFASIGLDYVELPVHGLDAVMNGRLNRKKVGKIKEILSDFDFRYTIHSPNPLNLMDRENFTLHLDVFRASLEFAAEIGSEILVYHSGRFIPEEKFPINKIRNLPADEKKRLLKIEAEALEKLSDEYPEVIICLENARPYLFHSPYCYAEKITPLKEQVERINKKNVKIILDIGHLNMAANFYHFDPVKEVSGIKNLISHTHIHDNFGGAVYHYEKIQTFQLPFGRGDSHMPVGWGNIPIREILSTYIDSYKGALIMELRSRYFYDIEESADNIRRIMG